MGKGDVSAARQAAENEALAARCDAVGRVAGEAIDWLKSAGALVREAAPVMEREFRREGLRAKKLAAAARRPMCVSVFGPSQQGKSYLVGSLARKGSSSTMIRFGDVERDFVRDLNPAGNKESTGLVTRFTVRPLQGLPGMPVCFRMLSQTDIVKIMANAFMEDFDRDSVNPLDQSVIDETLARLRKRAAAQPVDSLGEDDVYDLFEYFEQYFKNHPSHVVLKGSIWREMETLAPRLSIPDRVELFGLLWNSTPTMSRVAVMLLEALGQLDFPEEAFAGLEALEPKETSVIDVATMQELATGGGDRIAVATRAGRRAELPRSVLTAIIAELQLQLADKPFEFFDYTDLLDFPGARARGVEKAQDAEREAQKNIFLLVRRGKVAYLYQRYLAEQELTSMLLCFRPGNQDVPTVPHMVYDWISSTHGADPKDRIGRDVALFIVYTMFDIEFGEKAGLRDDSVERWSTRLETTLFSFLGKSHGWVKDWTPGKPFDNIYWLRNPSAIDKGLLNYDDHNVELSLRDTGRIDMLRGNYLANEDVRRHFADPGQAWDAALKLNDGGIAYIAEKLGPVCNPAVKRQQVQAQLVVLAERMAKRLEPFFISNDQEAEVGKRREEARVVGRQLLACAQAQAFGLLLRELQVNADELSVVFRQQQLALTEGPSIVNAPVGARSTARTLSDEFDSAFDDEVPAREPPRAEPAEDDQAKDMADVFAEAAVRNWLERMERWAARGDVPSLFQLNAEAAAILVGQLSAAARRLSLRDNIADQMRAGAAYHERLSDRMLKPVLIAERKLNDFVTWLGFDGVEFDKRPKAGRDRRPVFARPPAAEDYPELAEVPLPYESTFYIDWASSFVKLVEDNVRGRRVDDTGSMANARLGAVLTTLSTAATA